MDKKKEDNKGLTVTKSENFSEWYTQVIEKAELADIRYNIKGFLVFQPWSVISMEKMYSFLEKALQKKGHKPYFFPTLIPESNLKKETSHIQGFTPSVFWVTEGGDKKLEERYAMRPTSETAFYQMFALWIRSYKDLPFKTYQRANVFRYETKATRPFLRSREFHWIETHCAFPNLESAETQVKEDMETTKDILHDTFGVPFIFFQRPEWDKFPGAYKTFAADAVNPDGKLVQQPSTHIIKQEFSKAFDVKYKDKDGQDKYCYLTCYGPAVSRIFASVIITHGDDKGLRFPWDIAPVQVAIVPIGPEKELSKKADEIKKALSDYSVEIDASEKSPGEKFNLWELKGVPIRIDLGLKELKDKKLTIFRRDLNKKETVAAKDLLKYIEKVAKEFTSNLIKQADKVFEGRIKDAQNIEEIKKAIESNSIARCSFCSTSKEGAECAATIEKQLSATVRGTKLETEKAGSKCAICGKKANHIVYIGRQY